MDGPAADMKNRKRWPMRRVAQESCSSACKIDLHIDYTLIIIPYRPARVAKKKSSPLAEDHQEEFVKETVNYLNLDREFTHDPGINHLPRTFIWMRDQTAAAATTRRCPEEMNWNLSAVRCELF